MRARVIQWVSVLSAAGVTGGCLQQRLTITSEPSGALVYIAHEEVGRTPLTISFTWYGDYDIILRRRGCETLKTHFRMDPPIYAVPPLDLFSEVAPWTYRDHRVAHFRLKPLVLPTDEDLIRRAERLRRRALAERR